MVNDRSTSEARPAVIALLVMGFYLLWFVLPPLLRGTAPGETGDREGLAAMASALRFEVLLVASVSAICFLIRDWKGLHASTSLNRHWLWFLLPVLIYLAVVALAGVIALDRTSFDYVTVIRPLFVSVILTTLLVGVFEEFLFRGIVFRGLNLWRGPVVAFVLSSVLFGLMHYVNWIGGQSLATTHLQVLHAGAAGLLYAGIMLKTGSIWVSVLIHASWDSLVSVNQTIGMLAANQAATPEMVDADGFSLVQAAIMGFEPIYGIVLFLLWLRYNRSHPARATG